MERESRESKAQIRIFPKDQNPKCVDPMEMILQILGNLNVIKKVLWLVSNSGSFLIDSDTTITFLEEAAYSSVMEEVVRSEEAKGSGNDLRICSGGILFSLASSNDDSANLVEEAAVDVNGVQSVSPLTNIVPNAAAANAAGMKKNSLCLCVERVKEGIGRVSDEYVQLGIDCGE
ncbi:hypothetical protein SUGI_0277690 [Cryptomeria japonica]|nr:hypothetical protein SUGI_0277690 [Cryptomeria japonica]